MRKTTTESRWRALIAEQERSGLSVREFAEARGISAWSLYGWRSRLGLSRAGEGRRGKRRRRREADPELVAVEIVGPRSAVAGATSDFFEVELGHEVRVRVPRGFDEAELSRLVSALRSSC